MSKPLLTSVNPQPQSRAGVIGFVSLVLGLAALGSLGGAILIWRAGEGPAILWAASLSFVSFLFAIAAGVTGFIGRLRPIKAKASLTGLVCGGAAILLLIPAFIYAVWTLGAGRKSVESIAVAPTIVSEEAMVAEDFRVAWQEWTKQHAVEPVLRKASGRADEAVTSEILEGFVREWTNERGLLQQSDWNLLAARLADVTSKDPIPLLIVASRSDDPAGAIISRGPINLLRSENVSPFWNLLLELQRARTLSRTNSPGGSEESLKLALAALDQLLAEGAFSADQDWLLADLIVYRLDKILFEADFARIEAIMETHHRSEWLIELLRGKHESILAWKSRGGGYANTVTQEGRKGFLEHLGRARSHYERSWSIAPQFPFAATEMIGVSMGSSTNPQLEMKTWLDRASAAHADSSPAYSAFLWGMRPRWHGSHREILAHGESWLATGRFDTNLPSYYIKAVEAVADETKLEIYRRPGVYEKVVSAHEGYITAVATLGEERYRRTCLAITAFHTGHFEDLRKQWELLGGNPDREALASQTFDPDDFLFRATMGEGSPAMRRALAATTKQNFAAATKEWEVALKESGWSTAQTEALAGRLVLSRLAERYARGEMIDLFSEDRRLWRAVEGRFVFDSDGAISATSDSLRYAIEHPLHLGENFEIELELETRGEMLNLCGPGILLSDKRFDTKNWLGYYVRRSGNRRANVVALHLYAPYLSVDTPARDRTTLRLVCHDTSWEAFADGERIHPGELKVLYDHIGERTRLCLNGWTTTPTTSHSQRFLGLRVRQLEAPSGDGIPEGGRNGDDN